MDATQRNRDGTFKTGHKSKGGRPPNNFSIGAALSKSANEVETVTDDGTPVTRAQLAAKWLWHCVVSGEDRGEQLVFKDRLAAFQAVKSAIEPIVKINAADLPEEPEDDLMPDVATLTGDELKDLQRLLMKSGDTAGADLNPGVRATDHV